MQRPEAARCPRQQGAGSEAGPRGLASRKGVSMRGLCVGDVFCDLRSAISDRRAGSRQAGVKPGVCTYRKRVDNSTHTV